MRILLSPRRLECVQVLLALAVDPCALNDEGCSPTSLAAGAYAALGLGALACALLCREGRGEEREEREEREDSPRHRWVHS
jgi:hypothetical protein